MLQIKPLGVNLQKVACSQLGEVPEQIPEILGEFKKWIQRQPHLTARTEDQFLIQFLRNCNYDLERAKEKLDNYYSLISKYPNILSIINVDDVQFRQLHNKGCFVALPIPLNGCGPRIFVFRFNFVAGEHSFESIFLPAIAQFEVMMMTDPYTCIHGAVIITDLSKATLQHFLQITPKFLKPLFTFFENALPINIQSFGYINVPTYAEQFFKILRSSMSETLRDRVFICGQDINNITERVPLKYLPSDMGGSNSCLEQVNLDYNKVFDEHRQFFRQNAKYGVDETLRPGGPKEFECEYGIGGSFEQLNVD